MKRTLFVVFMAVFALLPCAVVGQSYEKMWREVDKAQNLDKPKTALAQIDKIISTAQSRGDKAELLKALVGRMNLSSDISQDSAKVFLKEISALASRQQTAVDRSMYQLTLGWLLGNLNSHLYTDCRQKAIECFALATSDAKVLAEAKASSYLPILRKGKDSRYYGDDLLSVVFPFAAEELKQFYSAKTDSLCSKILGREISYYQQKGMREAALLSQLDSIHICHAGNAARLREMLKEYGDLELSAWVAEELCNYLPSAEQYALATETLKKFPHSPAAQSLKNTLTQITLPHVSLSGTERIAYPKDEFKVCISHRNLRNTTLVLYRLPLNAWDKEVCYGNNKHYQKLKAMGRRTDARTFTLSDAQPWEFSTDTIDYRMPDEAGIYLMELSSPQTETEYRLLHVSSLALTQIAMPKGMVKISAIDARSGHPVSGALLKVESHSPAIGYRDYAFDDNGEITLKSENCYARIFVFTPNDKGHATTMLSSYYDAAQHQKHLVRSARLFTDRAIYRPGQTVKVGGIIFEQQGDSTRVLDGQKVELELHDANYKTLEKATLLSDELGNFSTEFRLPESCLNGHFSVRSSNGSVSFKVEEYKRPEFKVTLKKPETAYQLGDTLQIEGEVKTYSGLPLAGVRVCCSSLKQTSWWYRRSFGERFYPVRDTLTTNESGLFSLPVVLEKGSEDDDSRHFTPQFFTFNIEAKATSFDGETEETLLQLYASNIKTYISTNIPQVLCKEHLPKTTVTQLNAMGEPTDEGDGFFRIKNISGRNFRFTGHLTFNKGEVEDVLKLFPSGRYELIVRPADETDTLRFFCQKFTLISLKDTRPISNEPLQLWQSGEYFDDEGKAELLVATPLKDAALYYNLFAKDELIESRIIQLSDTVLHLSYKYKEEWGDGLRAVFSIYRDGQWHQNDVTFLKPLPHKQLQRRWTTFRDKLTPGSQETWTLQLLKDGRPVEASLLATLYDARLDKFGKHRLPFYLSFNRDVAFINWNSSVSKFPSLTSSKRSSLLNEASLLFTQLCFDRQPKRQLYLNDSNTDFRSALRSAKAKAPMYAAGVMREEAFVTTMDCAATFEQEEEEVDLTKQIELRQEFDETALFAPALKTNAQGEVSIEFKVPQSLTSWNLLALAHTRDLCYAIIDTVANVQKQLTIQSNMPRFLRSGDKTTLVLTIRNNTDLPQQGKAQLALLDAQSGRQLSLRTLPFKSAANSLATVEFPIEANADTPLLICRYVAQSDNFSDGEQQYLPVLSDAEETLSSVPFALDNSKEQRISLKSLDFNPKALRSQLIVEYMGNPTWSALTSLPSTIDYQSKCASQLAVNYSSLLMMQQILKNHPQIQQMLKAWKEDSSVAQPLLSLENNEELKQVLLDETPWTMSAASERQRLEELTQDSTTIRLKQASMLHKLRSLQSGSGAWSWFDGMYPSLYLTLDIALTLEQTRQLCPEFKAESQEMMQRAIAYLDSEAKKAVAYMKKEKSQQISTSWMQYLYIVSQGQWQSNAERKYLVSRLEESARDYNLYDKAMAAVILKRAGLNRQAQETVESLHQYLVSSKEMGTYFDSRRAPQNWSMYKIPTQVAAIEAFREIWPDSTELVASMTRHLVQSRHSQSWASPFAAAQAIRCMLQGGTLNLQSALPSTLRLQFRGNRSIDLSHQGSINPFIAMGYLKQQIDSLDNAPQYLDVLPSLAQDQQFGLGAVYLKTLQPITETSASGSKLSLTTSLWRDSAYGWLKVSAKDVLKVGDRVMMRIEIDAERDMDYVSLIVGRAAAMEPTSTTSGYEFASQAYRDVKDASTRWYFDRLSKGRHVVEQTFNIDRSGTFQTACPRIQSLYAPEFTARARSLEVNVE